MKYSSALIFSSAVLLLALEWNGYPASQPPQPPPQATAESKPGSQGASQSAPEQPSQPKPKIIKDINVWSYTPEFAARFKKPVLGEPGPSGAHAVAFQVKWAEELDLCVFDAYLNNQLPIDYPEGDIGVLPFIYPRSSVFLKIKPEDRQKVDTAYLSKYNTVRAFIQNQKGEQEPLLLVKYRRHLYADVAYLSFTLPCDRVPPLGVRQAVLRIRTTAGSFHDVGLVKPFLERLQTMLTERRRKDAVLAPDRLGDINVWAYTPEFAQRFGLPALNEPGPSGAQAVAYRVELNLHDPDVGDQCLLDLYIEATVPLMFPEGEIGFSWSYPDSAWFAAPRHGSPDRLYWSGYLDLYKKPRQTEWLTIKEVTSLWDRWTYRNNRKLEGNLVRLRGTEPLFYRQYRKNTFPDLSYITFDIGCMTATKGEDGETEIWIEKTDVAKHRVVLPKPFLKRMYEYYRVRVEIPHQIRLFGKPLEPQ